MFGWIVGTPGEYDHHIVYTKTEDESELEGFCEINDLSTEKIERVPKIDDDASYDKAYIDGRVEIARKAGLHFDEDPECESCGERFPFENPEGIEYVELNESETYAYCEDCIKHDL